ncbi:MAG: hypothetical protein ABIW32_02005 [Terrimesophilobacter sp.]
MVEKLAVLLTAGVPPAAAWVYLAESSTGGPGVVSTVAKSAASGGNVASIILTAVDYEVTAGVRQTVRVPAPETAVAWRGLAAAWIVAT